MSGNVRVNNLPADVSTAVPLPVTIISGGGGGGGDASAANQVTQITSLQLIDDIVQAEDAVHASGDKGVMLLAVRKDTATALAGTDGDYIPVVVDANGRLHVVVPNMPASIGQKAKAAALPVTLASDEDLLATAGAIADAIVAAGAAGSISAKLRRATQGLEDLKTLIVMAAGENHIGQVSGHSAPVVVTPTVSTTPAYTSGDSIGGKITLSNAVRVSAGTGWLTSLQISDLSNQKPTGTILVFNADASTTYTDNAAAALSNADAQKIVAQIPVSTGDYTTINNRAVANPMFNPKQVKAASGTTLYAIFVTTSTPTFASTTDIQLTFGFAQD
jgi:hypothetical protein